MPEIMRKPLPDNGFTRAQKSGHMARLGHELVAEYVDFGTGEGWELVWHCCQKTIPTVSVVEK